MTTFEPGIAALKLVSEQTVIGRDALDLNSTMADFERRLPAYPRHLVTLEMALLDLASKTANLSLSTYLGGRNHETIPVLKMLGMGSTDFMAKRAAHFVKQGYRNLKIKLGAGASTDLERFEAVREAVGSGVQFTADFNGAYDAATAIRVSDQVTPLVLADQSVNTPADVARIADVKASGRRGEHQVA